MEPETPELPKLEPEVVLPKTHNLWNRGLHPVIPVVTLLGLSVLIWLAFWLTYVRPDAQLRQKTTQTQVIPMPAETVELTLGLSSPVDGMVSQGTVLPIAGKTLPGTVVTFYTDTDSDTVVSDPAGIFMGELTLEPGINALTVVAMGESEEKTLAMEIIYDDQVLGVSSDKPNKVENKQAISGKVEKINDKQVEVKQKNNGKTEVMSIDKNTKVVNEKNKPIKASSIKMNDSTLVIPETVSATDAARIKKAVKIYVKTATDSAQFSTSKRQAVQGVVTEISGNTITLAHQIQRTRLFNILVTESTIYKSAGVGSQSATLTDIKVGSRITAVGTNDGTGTIVAAKIHIIPGAGTGIFNRLPVTPIPSMTPLPTVISTPSATPASSPTPTLTASPTAFPTITLEPQ